MKLTIDRARWYRGKGPTLSRLLREDGRMCFGGFYCAAMGIPPERLMGVAVPHKIVGDVANIGPLLSKDEFGNLQSSDFADRLALLNDSRVISGHKREIGLECMAADIGVEVEFV